MLHILKKLLCSITFCCGHQQKGWSGSVNKCKKSCDVFTIQNKNYIAIFSAIKITHPWLQVMQPVPLIIFIHAQDKLTFHSFIICYIFYFQSTSIFFKGTDLFISCNEGLILSRRKSKLGALIKTKWLGFPSSSYSGMFVLFLNIKIAQTFFLKEKCLCYFDKMFFV